MLLKKHNYKIFLVLVPVILFLFSIILYTKLLPDNLFKVPYSTVVKSEDGELLSAIIAEDGQWRFPPINSVPEKFKKCIIQYEDARFYYHPGFDIIALLRSLYINLKNKKIISGGSTITMQLIRTYRKKTTRSILEKIIEIFLAMRLELKYSKDEILKLYVSYVSFGGNVVGLEAASWRYYGISPENLSWGQAATLAVLPNSPSLVYPGKNEKILLRKRNNLLKKLLNKNIISYETYKIEISEPLPGVPKQLPQNGKHILARVIRDGYKGKIITTTINKNIQSAVQNRLNKHAQYLEGLKVYNVAAIVIDVDSGKVLAYGGNRTDTKNYNSEVDVINAPRSPGSILKPLLYCVLLSEGQILPYSIIPDIPSYFDDFHPENFNRTYDGVVRASNMLSRSLNVPAVYMLKNYSVQKFHHFLNKIGLTTISSPPSHYGLSLILGGAEVKLFEIAGVYASMARILKYYNKTKTYNDNLFFMPNYISNEKDKKSISDIIIDAGSIWYTFKAMIEVTRTEDEQYWYYFSSKQPIAWKTGTSYGERDAWAIGVTPKYVVGVWAGNATGEGRPGLTGIQAAAPLMFSIFDYLPKSKWFDMPETDMIKVNICKKSGYKASVNCEDVESYYVPKNGYKCRICSYHRIVHLDKSLKWQVHADCENINNIVTKKWFVLPPSMEYYYKKIDLSYIPLPPYREDCKSIISEYNMEILYPATNTKVYLIDEHPLTGKIVLRVAHKKKDAIVYWYIDDDFIGTTENFHEIEIRPSYGKHKLLVIDNYGEKSHALFEVLNK